jgi:hypothetical protein
VNGDLQVEAGGPRSEVIELTYLHDSTPPACQLGEVLVAV